MRPMILTNALALSSCLTSASAPKKWFVSRRLPRLPPSLPPFLLPLFFLFPPYRVLWHIYSVIVASNPMGHFLVMVWLVRTSGRG
jgi:hypothetical protein